MPNERAADPGNRGSTIAAPQGPQVPARSIGRHLLLVGAGSGLGTEVARRFAGRLPGHPGGAQHRSSP